MIILNIRKVLDMEDKEYDLYTEHIVKEPWKKVKRYLKKALVILLMAVFFGLVAGLVMLLVYKTGNKYIEEPPTRPTITLSGEEETTTEETTTDNSETESITVPPVEVPTNPTEAPTEEEPDDEFLMDYSKYYESLKKVAGKVNSSMVTVTASKENVDWFNSTYQNISEEYGLVVAAGENGYYILTDYSLVKNTNNLVVTYPDGGKDMATLMAGDITTNLAVLKTGSVNNTSVNVASLSDSAMVRQGDILIAVGKLYGFAGSMGYGMATGVNNSINDTDSCYRLINTDITGTESSSGVLANINGKVVGIVTTSYNSGSTNLVTAYAVSDIIDLVERLCNGRTTGYFGIRGQEVTDEIKQSNGIPSGIYVSVVETNSPAYSIGIQTGDVICGINSKPVTNMKEFMDILAKYDSGDSLNVTIKRKGRDMYKEIEFNLMLGVE